MKVMKHAGRTGIAILLVVASAATTSCTRRSGVKYPTPEQLSSGLLTVTDVESKWNETQRQVFDTRGNENPSIDPSIWCPAASTTANDLVNLAGDGGADVEMELKKSQAGTGSRLLREQAWSNENVKEYFTTASSAVDSCDGAEWTDQDSGVTNSIEKLSDAGVGDESVGFSSTLTPPASAEGEKFSGTGRLIIVRVKNTILVLQAGDFGPTGSASEMTDSEWKSLVETAVDKITQA